MTNYSHIPLHSTWHFNYCWCTLIQLENSFEQREGDKPSLQWRVSWGQVINNPLLKNLWVKEISTVHSKTATVILCVLINNYNPSPTLNHFTNPVYDHLRWTTKNGVHLTLLLCSVSLPLTADSAMRLVSTRCFLYHSSLQIKAEF